MWNNNYFNPYQNYMTPQTNTQKLEIVRVNGRNGAETFQMPPNSSTLLLDESNPVVWLCTTDGAGYKTITPYNVTPYKDPKEINFSSLEERIKKLEEIVNDKSHSKDVVNDTGA